MITRDITTETPDYFPQPGRHCGQLCVDPVCPVCREYVRLPSGVVLGDN